LDKHILWLSRYQKLQQLGAANRQLLCGSLHVTGSRLVAVVAARGGVMNVSWRAPAAALVICLFQQAASAAEIRILSIPGIKAALEQIKASFERESGHQLAIYYEIFTRQKKELEAGDFELAIFPKSQIAELATQGRIVTASTFDIARTSIGVAVRKGAPKPEISSEEAFKRTLLAAKSITYTKETLTGVHVTRLLDRFGIAEQVKDKVVLQPRGNMSTPAVADGTAEIAIVQVSDIVAHPGVDLVGPLPPSIQNYVVQVAAVGSNAKNAAAAGDLVKYLTSPAAVAVFKAAGLETGS
jgi:molybdate transport system substrate-binding protein